MWVLARFYEGKAVASRQRAGVLQSERILLCRIHFEMMPLCERGAQVLPKYSGIGLAPERDK